MSFLIPVTSSLRPRLDEALIAEAIRGLTDRDRAICSLLETHRVLTSRHLLNAFFESPERVRHRMATLYRRRIVDRFRPLVDVGSAPYHYVLDQVGSEICAAGRRDGSATVFKPPSLDKWRRSSQLAHLLVVNDFFTGVMGDARRSEATLATWWPQWRCANEMGGLAYPDGYGVWRDAGGDVEFYAEVDRGTETVGRVVSKIDGYEALLDATQVNRWVLFLFPNRRRETEFRRRLASTRVRIATAAIDGTGAAWASVESEARLWIRELSQPS